MTWQVLRFDQKTKWLAELCACHSHENQQRLPARQ